MGWSNFDGKQFELDGVDNSSLVLRPLLFNYDRLALHFKDSFCFTVIYILASD